MALAANYKDISVSSICSLAGPIVTIRAVLELPPNESDRSLVSLESLKGTCLEDEFSVKAWMQLPRAAREKFIFLASSNLLADT